MDSFTRDGVTIAFIDVAPTGPDRGEPVLLSHGFASTHAVNWLDTLWVHALAADGRRVIALDHRGHGASTRLRDPAAYGAPTMAGDLAALLEHLGVGRADAMGYSMGARIGAFLALARPDLVRALLLGGLGHHLVEGAGLPEGVAEAMEAPTAGDVADPAARGFRVFAERNGQDLAAMAACIRGSRQALSAAEVGRITAPTLITVGTRDEVAGDPRRLAAMMPDARANPIEGRDHGTAVGDRHHRASVLAFLDERP